MRANPLSLGWAIVRTDVVPPRVTSSTLDEMEPTKEELVKACALKNSAHPGTYVVRRLVADL